MCLLSFAFGRFAIMRLPLQKAADHDPQVMIGGKVRKS